MTDRVSAEVRSRIMRAVKGRDTKPERAIRSLLHGLGFRFRLHARDLPGTPDVVFRARRRAVFVHGCFWHGHVRCARPRPPNRDSSFWVDKIAGNRSRDRRVRAALRRAGWRSIVVWECEIANLERVAARLTRFLARRAMPRAAGDGRGSLAKRAGRKRTGE